jgi:tight adherence protein B
LRAQLDPTPQQLALLAGAFPLFFALVLGLAGLAFALLATAAMAATIILYVRARARRGIEALIDSLPVYLDGVRQLMVVGNSLSQALIRALPAAADPVRSYLGGAIRRIELGAPIGDSLQQAADRLAVPEIAMLSAAVRANLRFGGPIATILGNLAQILRERLRIKRELASATAEARVSTKMLIAFPLLLSLFLLTTNPAYRHFFFVDPRGHRLAAIASALQLIGMMLMLRLQRLAF